jgi:hypothetical protein
MCRSASTRDVSAENDFRFLAQEKVAAGLAVVARLVRSGSGPIVCKLARPRQRASGGPTVAGSTVAS